MKANILQKQLIETATKRQSRRMAFAHIDDDLTIVDTTPNIADVLALPQADIIGMRLADAIIEFIGTDEIISAVRSGNNPSFRIERVNRVNSIGTTHYYDFEVTRFDHDLNPTGLLLSIENTTSFGRLEQALVQERNELRLIRRHLAEANAELRRVDNLKSLFLSMAAHDLRAPLMVIRGYSELLLSMNKDEFETNHDEAVEFISTIQVQSDWLDHIINNVVDLDQIENDRLHLETLDCDLNAVIADAMLMLSAMSRLNGQTLTYEPAADQPFAAIDPQRIQQIMQNLVGNAIKYTPPGGEINVRLISDAETVAISISDNGRGMSPEQLEHIFTPYYRTTDAQRSQIKGTGLGLFIVKTMVEAHKGTILVESELGVGSTFTVTFLRTYLN